MKMIFYLLLLIGFNSFAQDSTLSETRNPAYHAGRADIIKPFKILRDSVVKANPRWKDSVDIYTKLIFTKIDSVTKSNYINRLNFSQGQLELLINTIREAWCPFANQLIAYNKKWHVVGDMKAHCLYYKEQP